MADTVDDAADDDDAPAEPSEADRALFDKARKEMWAARRLSRAIDARLAELNDERKRLTEERAAHHGLYMKWSAWCDGSAPPPPSLPFPDPDEVPE